MARAKLNSILVALIVAVGRLSAAGHDFCAASNLNVGIRVPSANHSNGWPRAYAPSFNLQPSILLEPTGIYGLRADGLNGWQKAGVWGTELIAGGVGHGLTFFPAFLGFVSAAYEGSQFTTRDMWLCLALWPGCGTIICPTAVWLTGRYGFKQNVSWWEPALGSGAGLAASSALIGLAIALDKYHGRSRFGNTVIDYMGYAGELGLAALIPIGAVIGANHR
jgi:hypothetical protein